MSSTDFRIKIMSKSPFVKAMTLAVIKNILSQKFSYEERHVIDTELVPRVSRKVALASLREENVTIPEKELVRPLPIPRAPMIPKPIMHVPPRQPITHPVPFQMAVPQISHQGPVQGDYGKITPLLNDPSVSSIECAGPNKPLTIIRSGQRQFTRISLNKEDLDNLIEEISEQARIPLIEGPFHAAVENFLINGVISEMVGSRFVIKKSTPYAMLERR